MAAEKVAHTPRAIPGYPGYEASPDGVIHSRIPWRGQAFRALIPVANARGYLKVRVETQSGRRNISVHRLVAAAFLGPRPSLNHEVRHRDGNRHNNACDNINWGTRKDNADDRERHGRTSRGRQHSERIKRGLAVRGGAA